MKKSMIEVSREQLKYKPLQSFYDSNNLENEELWMGRKL